MTAPDFSRCPKRTSRCPAPAYCQPTCIHAADWLASQGVDRGTAPEARPQLAPRYGVKKISADILPHAYDLLRALMGEDRSRLGPAAGDAYAETVCGHRIVAHRLRCGGIEVREVVGG